MAAVRAAGVDAFGVNLFVPGAPTDEPDRLEAYLASLRPLAESLGTELGAGVVGRRRLPGASSSSCSPSAPAVVSFTFGLPDPEAVRALRRAGSLVMVTVTTPEEADAGVAGRRPTRSACRAQRRAPTAAAWPTTTAPTLIGPCARSWPPSGAARWCRSWRPAAWLDPTTWPTCCTRGATLVQAGTAFLRCPESGAQPAAKDALADAAFTATAVTRAFSGRRARAVVNAMVREHPGRAAGLSRDQQRHPAAARRGGAGGRPRAHEPLRRHRLPCGPRRARRPRSWSGWCQDGAGDEPPADEDDRVHAARDRRGRRTSWPRCERRATAGSTSCPGSSGDARHRTRPPGLFAFFGTRQPPVTMATVMPARLEQAPRRRHVGRA